MFTHQFFDLLLNLDDNWQIKEVGANHKSSDITIIIEFMGAKSLGMDA